ncbi:unnamed protein product, partial [marine sediment metagenome]
MVKTRSPLLSTDATGSLAGLLTYVKSRRATTIRKLTRPKDPRSGAQLGRRHAFHFLTTNWAQVSAGDQATWADLPASIDLSNYNAYVRENMRVWSAFRPPSEAYPATLDGTFANITGGPAAYYEPPDYRFAIQSNLISQNWGVMYFASLTTSFSTAVENLANFTRLTTTLHTSSYWTAPGPGPWFFNARLFTTRGR